MRYTSIADLPAHHQEQAAAKMGNGMVPAPASTKIAPATNAFSAKFEGVWQMLGGPELQREVRFHESRRWRLDYCHMPTKIAIELEGGIYTQGRHNRAEGYRNDCEKYNAALTCGFVVFRLATGMATPEHILPIIEYMRG